MGRLPILTCLLVASSPWLIAQDKNKEKESPKVLYSVPLVIAPGSKSKVLLRGTNLAQLKDLSLQGDYPCKLIKAIGKAGPNNFPAQKVGDSEVELELELPKDYSGDTVQLNSVGKKLFDLRVDRSPSIAEKEENDAFPQAQMVELPISVNAKIDRDKDVDVYRFSGRAGQIVVIEVQAASLGSPADTLLTVYDVQRRTLASVDDVLGQPDPKLKLTLPHDGDYFISVIEVHDVGGPLFPYRLVIR